MFKGKSYQSLGTAINIVNGFLSPVAVVTNFLILLALWKTMSLQSASNIFVASLALADLCVGLFLQPTLVFINLAARYVSTEAFCVVFQFHIFLAYLFTALSLGTLTYLSIERSIALHWHLRYYEIVTTKKVTVTVIQLWVFQFVTSAIIWFAIGSYSILVALSVTRCALLYLGDLLHLHEYLENCKNTSQAGSKPSVDSTRSKCSEHVKIQSKDVHFPDNFKTFCFLLFSLSVF